MSCSAAGPAHSPNPGTAGTGHTAMGGWHLHWWILHLVKAIIPGCRTPGELRVGRNRRWDSVAHGSARVTECPFRGASPWVRNLWGFLMEHPPRKHNATPVPPPAPPLSPWGHHVGPSLAVTAGSRWWHSRAGARMATALTVGRGGRDGASVAPGARDVQRGRGCVTGATQTGETHRAGGITEQQGTNPSAHPCPQAQDLRSEGRCPSNSLICSSNYISPAASGSSDVGPGTSLSGPEKGHGSTVLMGQVRASPTTAIWGCSRIPCTHIWGSKH